MSHRSTTRPASLLFVLVAASGAQEAPPHDLSGVRGELAAMVEDGAAVGVVGLVARGGEVLLEEAAGELERGGAEMRSDSIFRIYSMTKPVTAVGALTLFDEGKFGLDDPVEDYLPELGGLRVRDPGDPDGTVPLERPLRVRDLFQHTSSWSYETPWRAVAAKSGDRDPDLGAMVRALGRLPLDFQPGAEWRYGISNDVLGALIEAVAEQPLDEFLSERVFEPLEMVDTGFFVPEEDLDRVATLHVGGRDGLEASQGWFVTRAERRPKLLEGGAGLFSTAGDYARFLGMLLGRGELDGVRVLEPGTVALMTSDQVGDVPKEDTLMGRDYGLGIAITVADWDSGTPGTWTWGGAAGTTFWIDPSTETIGVFLVQNWLDFTPSSRFGAAVDAALAGAVEEVERAGEEWSAEQPGAGNDDRPNVLFYLIDTCRADRTSVHGHTRPTTPFLEELAERSVVFERCYSQAPWTKPSMAAILTSRYPSEVGIHTMYQRLSKAAVTFPEVLSEAGWATAGFSANPIMGVFSNYTQGFDEFTESVSVNRGDPIHFSSGSAAKLNARIFPWLEGRGPGPTFLYVHSVDPHEEYEPAQQYLERFADPSGMDAYRQQWEALLDTRPEVPGNHLTRWNFDQAGIDPATFIGHGMDLYDADVLANDAEIRRLWERLQGEGWGEDTIVIVTADHGEEFFEHGGTSHGYSLYEELIHVPLIVHAPGLLPGGVRVDRPVRSIDLYPTLLDLLDLEPPAGLRGRSLVPLVEDPEGWTDQIVFSESAEDPMGRMAGSGMGTTTVMIDGGWKLHVNYVDPPHRERAPRELYDLGADPGETVDLVEANAARAARMEEQIDLWAAANLGLRLRADEIDPDDVDPALLAELEALGYLADSGESDLPDIGDALPVLARAVLEADEKWSLFALDPDRGQAEGRPPKDLLRGWHILDRGSVRGDDRDELLRLIYRGFELSDGRMAKCFDPRHAVGANHHGHKVDLVICFECSRVDVWLDERLLKTAAISADVEPAVSAAFRAEGVVIDGYGGG